MHSLELAKLAAWVASMGSPMVRLRAKANQAPVHDYWLASRFRFETWSHRLREHRANIDRPGTSHRIRKWFEVMPVFQEILLSEPLTRCLACLGGILESRGWDRDFGPLAHSALISHIEMRHRCLNLIVFGHGLPVDQAAKLNRLRRQLEIYNDQLLGCLPPTPEIDAYAFEGSFVSQTHSRLNGSNSEFHQLAFHVQALAISLERMLSGAIDSLVVSARPNEKLAKAALGILPSCLFDSFGFGKTSTLLCGQHDSAESDGNTSDLTLPLLSPLDILLKPHGSVRAGEGNSKHGRI